MDFSLGPAMKIYVRMQLKKALKIASPKGNAFRDNVLFSYLDVI